MNNGMTPIKRGDPIPALFAIGKAVGVEREKLRSSVGAPHYVESDSARTFGGEEDWWAYRLPEREVVVICLAVPYMEAQMLTSAPENASCTAALKALLGEWSLEFYDRAYAA